MHQISVKEICERADVNRSTFYRNYQDLYDLFAQVEKQLTEQVFRKGSMFVERERLLTVIYQNQAFYREFFKRSLKSSYVETVMLQLKEQVRKILQQQDRYDEKTFNLEYQYNYYVVLGIIKDWLQAGCKESPEKLGKALFVIVDRQYQIKKDN